VVEERMPRRRTPPNPSVRLPSPAVAGESFEQYLRDIRDLPMITNRDEEREVARQARDGDLLAAERLVTANLRFVIAFVKRYQGHGLDLAELVAIGNDGLLRAVRKFDPDRGVKFISYAVWWVRQAVLKALAEQTRTVRFPLNQNTAVVRFAKAQGLLAQELGRTPTDQELATALQQSVDDIRAAKRLFVTEVSLDAPADRHDSRTTTLGERLPVGDSSEIETQTDTVLRRDFLDRLFRRYLTPRERRILSLYYGLDPDGQTYTLEEIGTVLGVTRERIRQLRERAFAKLRECPEVRHLGEFRAA
jgi:RNA polymerase primary sigma factor